ncbi:methyltransferase [Streptomyces sp. NPDC047123]|uniref:methyltransferase n=1 Tax=Streptomyces sp. NPDC047123 TaxID=3155622 RepID=UPI0034043011
MRFQRALRAQANDFAWDAGPPHIESASGRHAVSTDRAQLVAADMFTASDPRGSDTYLLSRALDNRSEKECLHLLRTLRKAMAPHSRLLILEMVVQDGKAGLLAPLWDLHLMVVNGGHQRSIGEYHRLAESSGLAVDRSVSLPMEASALVLTPVG